MSMLKLLSPCILFSCIGFIISSSINMVDCRPQRIIVDTDVDQDDVLALFYLLKQNRSQFDLQGITINANGWSDAGHAVNHVYDILFMMDRDDIVVGVGGEGVILPNGTISPNLGGYLPLIDQGMSTAGGCRYREAIPVGQRGRQNVNSNFGLRKGFLPQGDRKYNPLDQPTAQQVMKDAVSAGPINVLLMGSHTNLAIFLMTNPHLKKNIEHIYAMGGSVRPKCSLTEHCSILGNLLSQDCNPYAEYNIFEDPFAAYTVLHSGIPVTLVPLDATNTIPVTKDFFSAFEKRQDTYEAQYCFQSLKMARDTWPSDGFYEIYSLWDLFMAGVALSEMHKISHNQPGENEFAEMEYMNITVVTSNEPYGISDGSNPLIDGRSVPKFGLQENGVHSGHVQMGMQDSFCLKMKCQDGYTNKVTGPEGVQVLVATEAKQTLNVSSSLDKAFYESFLDVINRPERSGRFNIRTQFPYYREVFYRPNFARKQMGKALVFDMDMSTGDFLALFYLLKLPSELIDLKAILVSPNGWTTAATIDVVYDVLHMMGRDDIPVGLGEVYEIGQPIGGCKYTKAIPNGAGGFLDSDTLYGLARELPRSPRRYTAENAIKFGAPRDTDHPELRQPTSLDVWKSVVQSLDPGAKITLLTSGPLTNIAHILNSGVARSEIQDIYIVGGHINQNAEKGNIFTSPSNVYGEFNMFLDPLAARTVLNSEVNVTLVPLQVQRRASSFDNVLEKLQLMNATPEALLAKRLISRLRWLKWTQQQYDHVDMFLGEILGAAISAGDNPNLNERFQLRPIKVMAEGDETKGQIIIDEKEGKLVKTLESVNEEAYYEHFAIVLGDRKQSAVIRSFEDQKVLWSTRSTRRRLDHKLKKVEEL